MAALAVLIKAALTKIAGRAVVKNAGSHISVNLGKKVLFTSQSEMIAKQFADGFNMGMRGQKLAGHNLLSTKMGFHKAQEVTGQLKTNVQKRVASEVERDLFSGSDQSRNVRVRSTSPRSQKTFRRSGRGNRYNASNVKGANAQAVPVIAALQNAPDDAKPVLLSLLSKPATPEALEDWVRMREGQSEVAA